MRTLSLHLLRTPVQRHWSSLSWKHRMDLSQRKGPDGAQDARGGITLMPTKRTALRCFPHHRLQSDQISYPRASEARFILRLPDPVESLARDSVLSQKEAQLGRMFLHVAQGVQLEFEKAHRLPPPPGESNLAVRLLV